MHAYKHINVIYRHIHCHILSSYLFKGNVYLFFFFFFYLKKKLPYSRIFGSWNITRKRKIKSTPRRSIRAARASLFTEWQISKFSSVVIRASHTRSDIPGPKSGLTVLIHSPWLFLNSYLLFEWLISSAGNVYIRTVFHLTRFGIISELSFNIVESIKRWQSAPYNQSHGTWKGFQRWYMRLLICISFINKLFQTWNFVLDIVLKDCTWYKMTCINIKNIKWNLTEWETYWSKHIKNVFWQRK